jgi:NAD(P)-dependent dehydrogenase (short-subunit alcohol dehydrogenase family)
MTGTAGRVAGMRVLITGAGSGIGEATAILFAREGASVGLVGRTMGKLEDVASRIRAEGGEALVLAADVGREEQISGAVARLVAAWGGLDACVAVAGIERFAQGDDRVDRLDLSVWQEIVDTNLTGMFLTCKHAIRAMLASGGGALVVTGSPTAQYGFALGEDAYAASKAGCHGLARIMASEYAREGIRVNCVIPGVIDTPINALALRDYPDDMAAMVETVPLRRIGHAEDVAPMNLWLCTNEATYVTGGFFVVDGGLTAV